MNPTSADKTRIESEIAALRRRRENLLEQVDALSAIIRSLKAELQDIISANSAPEIKSPDVQALELSRMAQASELCRILKEDPDPEVRRGAAEAIGALFSETPAPSVPGRIPTEAKAPKPALKKYF